jgi:hypothetical protein
MSRFNVRHAVVVALTLLVVGAIAFWLADSDTSTNVDAPSLVDAPPPAKSPHGAPAKARRTKPAVATSPDAPRAAVVVRVVATTNRAAIAGAAVYVTDGGGDDWRAETDDAGAARFDELAVGQATLHVEAANRMPANRPVAFAAGANKDLEVALDDAVAIEGSVVDADSGVALSGATVRLQLHGANGRPDQPLDETTTDAAGRFRFSAAPAGAEARVTVSASEHARGLVTTVMPTAGGGAAQVGFRLDRTGTLRGIVRDPDGRPSDDAWVHVASKTAPNSAGFDAVTDDGGAFVVREIPVGAALAMTAGAPEWADAAPVDVPTLTKGALDATVDIALRRTATLVVRVLDPSGAVVVDAVVSLDGSRQTNFTANAEQSLVRKNLTPGDHHLLVRAKGFPDAERDFTAAESERVEIAVQFAAGVSVAGVVVDDAGAPVTGAPVFVVDPSTEASGRVVPVGPSPATTDADGAFRIDGLGVGRHRLAVFSRFRGTTTQQVDAPADGIRIVVPAAANITLHIVLPPGARRPAHIEVSPNIGGGPQGIGVDARGSYGIDMDAWLENSVVRGDVPPKATALRIRVEGYAPVVVQMRPEPGKLVDLGEVRLEVGVDVRGRVVDGDGRPVPGASVGCAAGSTTAASDGSFVVPHAAPGRIALHATTDGLCGAAVVDAAADAAPVTIVARRKGVLHGVVVDAAGAPVKGAVVVVQHDLVDATDEGVTIYVATSSDGTFMTPVAAGRCRAVLGETSAEANIPEGGEATVRLVVQSR